QVIPWVRAKDSGGHVTEYVLDGQRPTAEEVASVEKRRMDCVDCHNRPSHVYVPPDRAVDQAFLAGRLDPSVPYLKREAVAALARPYASTEEALAGIGPGLDEFYRTN